MIYTTLNLLREADACQSDLKPLISSLPANHPEDKLIPLSHILKSNGLEHAIWALRATTEDSRKIAARMAIEFAWQCITEFEKKYPEDKRPRAALQTASDFLDGKATPEDMKVAAYYALAAVDSAYYAAASHSAWAAYYAAETARFAADCARHTATNSAQKVAEYAWFAAEYAWYAASYAQDDDEAAQYAVDSACSEQVKIFRRYLKERNK